MIRIDAVVRPERLAQCLSALDLVGAAGVTVYEARGHGVQGGLVSEGPGESCRVMLLPKTVLMIVVSEHQSVAVVEALTVAARSGHTGDGKIFVSRIDDAIRVRTGESGLEALRP